MIKRNSKLVTHILFVPSAVRIENTRKKANTNLHNINNL